MSAGSGSIGRRRYRYLARSYDVLSSEPLYRGGRERALDLLDLRPGDRVLDLGCGTGLNLPLLLRRVGPSGHVVAVDASAAMLAQAGARVRRASWSNVSLLCADAQELEPDVVRRAAGGPCDVGVATYALSLMPRWWQAWDVLRRSCRPGARVAVVDTQVPEANAPLRAAGRLACWLGGVDVTAQPWQAVEQDCVDVTAGHAWAGHVQVRAGRLRQPYPGSSRTAPAL